MTDSWNPAQYEKFFGLRRKPFDDLVALVDVPGRPRVVDLGCGPATLTAELKELWGASEILGVDNSSAMLSTARDRGEGLTLVEGDIGDADFLGSLGRFDVVLANAALQWVPGHRAVLGDWTALLDRGGQLAVQVPANHESPAHLVALDVAHSDRFLGEFGGEPPPDPVIENVLTIEEYSELFDQLGFDEQHVRAQIYPMHLDDTDALVEWVKGTTLTRFQRVLSDEVYEDFLACYRDELRDRLGDPSPYFYPFKRYLMWGRKS